jgi:hypothetical protein
MIFPLHFFMHPQSKTGFGGAFLFLQGLRTSSNHTAFFAEKIEIEHIWLLNFLPKNDKLFLNTIQ